MLVIGMGEGAGGGRLEVDVFSGTWGSFQKCSAAVHSAAALRAAPVRLPARACLPVRPPPIGGFVVSGPASIAIYTPHDQCPCGDRHLSQQHRVATAAAEPSSNPAIQLASQPSFPSSSF